MKDKQDKGDTGKANEQKSESSTGQAGLESVVQGQGILYSIKTLNQTKERMTQESNNLKGEVRLGRLQVEVIADDPATEGVLMENAERTVFKKKLSESREIDSRITQVDQKIKDAYTNLHKSIDKNKPAEGQEEAPAAESPKEEDRKGEAPEQNVRGVKDEERKIDLLV
ncbi:hypothetical protein LJK87_37840 [Paenibacillus sp. P25]|nr:hypothetical protein LJK87_37840 [Paenibacillus sp. P25]